MADTTTVVQQGQASPAPGAEELVAVYDIWENEYHSACYGAALYDASHHGRIWMGDRDRANLLNRLSTNKIEGLQPGQGCQTVLTNHNGRIIDLLTVYVMPERLLLVTSPQQREAIYTLLRKNIFFQDKVKLEQASASLSQLHLYGPRSAALLAECSGVDVAALPLYHSASATVAGANVWLAHIKPLCSEAVAIYMPAEAKSAVWESLRESGAAPLGEQAFNLLRVEAGQAAFGQELSLEYIPLETGLWDAISFTKGCYVGQEIIARMESRNRLAKVLRGLKLETGDSGLAIGSLELPMKLEVAGKEAGDLTSVVHSPRFGPIGLAYVRAAHAEPGTSVGIAGSSLTAEVVELPF
jgi:aminomethyltransferase